jgi:hypothetical protein
MHELNVVEEEFESDVDKNAIRVRVYILALSCSHVAVIRASHLRRTDFDRLLLRPSSPPSIDIHVRCARTCRSQSLAIHVVASEFCTRPPKSPVRRRSWWNIPHLSQWRGMIHMLKAAILFPSLNMIGLWATNEEGVAMEVTKAPSRPHRHGAGLLSSYEPLSGANSVSRLLYWFLQLFYYG